MCIYMCIYIYMYMLICIKRQRKMSYMIRIYEYKALWIYQDTNRTSCSQVAIFKSLQLQTFTICSHAAIA